MSHWVKSRHASIDILRAISDNGDDKNARDLLVLSSAIIGWDRDARVPRRILQSALHFTSSQQPRHMLLIMLLRRCSLRSFSACSFFHSGEPTFGVVPLSNAGDDPVVKRSGFGFLADWAVF